MFWAKSTWFANIKENKGFLSDGFYFEQMKYCELFDNDALYEGKS